MAVRALDDIALELVGPDAQQITLPDMGNFSELTVEFWMYASDSSLEAGPHLILENIRDPTAGINAGIQDSHVFVRVGGMDKDVVMPELAPPGWTHVAIACAPNKVNIYVDSDKIAEIPLRTPVRFQLPETRVGGGITSLPFIGLIKELRIWNTTLSHAQITSRAFETVTSDSRLMAIYPMSGPLSATAAFLDDLTGRYAIRPLGGKWARAPNAPPGVHLPTLYHHAKTQQQQS